MKTKILHCTLLLSMLFLLSGCGVSYDLTKIKLEAPVEGIGHIAVVVFDQRPFVLSGTTKSNFIGVQWQGWTAQVTVARTRSKKPLAEDVAALLSNALRERGYHTEPLAIDFINDLRTSIEPVIARKYDRIIALDMKQFRSDTWFDVELQWDIGLSVFDGEGNFLGQDQNMGVEEKLDHHTMTISTGRAQRALSQKLAEVLYDMLATEKIQTAMTFKPAGDVAVYSVEEQKALDELDAVDKCYRLLEQGDTQAFRLLVIDLYKKRLIKDEPALDRLAELIWENRESMDGVEVDAFCHLCKIFMKSRNPRYKSVFTKLGSEAKARKLRKYALATVPRLGVGAVEQFKPGVETL